MLICKADEIFRRLQIPGDDDSRNIIGQHALQPFLGDFGWERGKIGHFAIAEQLHPLIRKMLKKPGKLQTRAVELAGVDCEGSFFPFVERSELQLAYKFA